MEWYRSHHYSTLEYTTVVTCKQCITPCLRYNMILNTKLETLKHRDAESLLFL